MSEQSRKPSSTEKPVGASNMSTFLSSIAVLLSVIALGGTGFALTQMFQLQQNFSELKAKVQSSPAASQPPQSSQTASSPTVTITESSQQVNSEIQPGQFVQYAFQNRAQVELLSVKRIQNPDNGQRNIVNVQMRVRNLEGTRNDVIVPRETIARNPETSERYEAYDRITEKAAREKAQKDGTKIDRSDRIDRATSSISMGLLKEGSSADGYVWLLVPEEVQTIDLMIPETATFLTVPISD